MYIFRSSISAIILACLLMILTGCAGGGATANIRTPEIAFMHGAPDEALQLMNADGTNVRTVLTTAASTLTFDVTSLGPDGQHIVFKGADPAISGPGIYIVKIDGTGLTRLIKGDNPSFNGSKIAFRDIGNFSNETLYLMNADGSNPQPVATIGGNGLQFGLISLSPDGSFIVFDGFPTDGITPVGVYRIAADGTGLTRLAHGQDSSSNGSKVAFVLRNPGADTLFVMNVDGSDVQTVLTSAGSGLQLNETSISPDGTKIVFQGVPNPGTTGIYIVNVDGTGLTRLADGRNPSIR